MSLVAISGAYGAGGSRIGPALAQRLSVPFLDRAIPAAVADELGVPFDEAAAHDEHAESGWLARLLRGFVGQDAGAPVAPVSAAASADDFRRATEQVLRKQIESGAGVILGRGAVIMLLNDPTALRVRLHGPSGRRVRQAIWLEGIDEETARRRLRQQDRTHAAYARHFYGVDIDDPGLYHVALDSTAIALERCVELLEQATRALATAEQHGSG